MLSSKRQVSSYLALAKRCAVSAFTVSPRGKNLDFLREWGIGFEEAKEIVLSLKPADYVKGPCRDDKRFLCRNDIWVFGKRLQLKESGVEAYIKLTIALDGEGLGCLCISFHESERPLRYAFGGEQREVYFLLPM